MNVALPLAWFQLRQLKIIAASLICALALPAFSHMNQRPAEASVTLYRQITRPFPKIGGGTVDLLTRGYIDDSCMALPGPAACMSAANPMRLRPEASAQALAIWALAGFKADLPLVSGSGFQKVDWEVGPPPNTALVADTEDPPEPPGQPGDECDPDAPSGVKVNTDWRIDIVVDQATIIEAKNWNRRGVVANQLTCYIDAANQRVNVNFAVNSELNAVAWVAPIVAPARSLTPGKIWCSWAPADPALTGHLYFAELVTVQTDLQIPREVEQKCHPDPARGRDPALDPALAAAAIVRLAAILAALLAAERWAALQGRLRPAPVQSYQVATGGQVVSYDVAVLRLQDRPRQLTLDFGHGGAPTVFNVPAGSGAATFRATTTFPSGARRYVQRFSVGSSPALLAAEGTQAAATAPNEETFVQTVTDIGIC